MKIFLTIFFTLIFFRAESQFIWHEEKIEIIGDTIPMLFLMSDTTTYTRWHYDLYLDSVIFIQEPKYPFSFYAIGFQVREQHDMAEGNGTRDEWYPHEAYWKHICFLAENKKPFPSSYIIWQTKELK